MNQKYLSSKLISTVENLQLRAKFIVEGFMTGLHKSPFHGFSVEFSEHRSYTIGDEVKNIDWKIWSKTDKYYVKRFEEETNLLCHIFLDASKSMSFTSNVNTKFEYAKTLASCLSYLMINQRDSVGLHVFDSKIRQIINPKCTQSHLNTILSIMNNLVPKNKTKISSILNYASEKINKKGLVIIISDLFDSKEDIVSALKKLKYNNQEVILFHILDEKEIDLNYNEQVKFEDLENLSTIKTEPWQIKDDYKKEMKNLIKYFKTECQSLNINYNLFETSKPIETGLLYFLNKRKKIL
tara:strand:+ start:4955 stop:5842 length:888 start_codon:yes stop_codon:yes gene_type:complete